MTGLTDPLPCSLAIGDTEYPIYTDFRHWIAFELLVLEPNMEEWEQNASMLGWFLEEAPPDMEAAVQALLWFYLGGRTVEEAREEERGGSAAKKTIYHFDKDAERIFASFASADGYLLDLEEVEYLHWWKFRAMLHHISPKTAIGRAMGLRATDDADLTESQRRLKRLCDLGDSGRGRLKTLSEREEELRQRAREARKRAELAHASAH